MNQPAVFDCNVFLQAMLSARGPAHACWQLVKSGDVTLFVSLFIVTEIRSLPEHRSLRRFRHFTPALVDRFIEELLELAQVAPDPPPRFSYPRDADDAQCVDLAIATGALLVVSNDLDLLALMDDSNPDGRLLRESHPTFAVLTPPQFLQHVRRE